MSNIDGLKKFGERINGLFMELENQEAFKNSSGSINGVMYDLYSKTKRSYQVSSLILESNIPNSYTETFPHLRLILESYLHSNYIRQNSDSINTIEDEYEKYNIYQKWDLGRRLENYNKEVGNLHPTLMSYISEYHTDKEKPKRLSHLENVKELASKTNSLKLYYEVYIILSSYLHYNPQTRGSYGSEVDGSFMFNRYEYKEDVDSRVRMQLLDLTLSVIRNVAIHFELNDFLLSTILDADKDWRFIGKVI